MRRPAATKVTPATEAAKVEWHHAISVGLPYGGHSGRRHAASARGPELGHVEPGHRQRAERAERLYGNEHTIRKVVSVIAGYRVAHPEASRVVVGDISRQGGGTMDEHVSHQNGLDVDIYSRGSTASSPRPSRRQIDLRLSQALLDRFIAAGAQMVFVGYSTGLRGPAGRHPVRGPRVPHARPLPPPG